MVAIPLPGPMPRSFDRSEQRRDDLRPLSHYHPQHQHQYHQRLQCHALVSSHQRPLQANGKQHWHHQVRGQHVLSCGFRRGWEWSRRELRRRSTSLDGVCELGWLIWDRWYCVRLVGFSMLESWHELWAAFFGFTDPRMSPFCYRCAGWIPDKRARDTRNCGPASACTSRNEFCRSSILVYC